MGNCGNCGCNDLGEVKTNEVQIDEKQQRNSAKGYSNPQSAVGTTMQQNNVGLFYFGKF